MDDQARIRELLFEQLKKQNAHISFENAVEGIPFEDLGKRPEGLPHSIWELTEHIRISVRDIIEFSKNPDYTAPDWPGDYWPDSKAPENREEWEQTLQEIQNDYKEMVKLIKDPSNDLMEPFEHGNGQTLFREAMLIVDHTSYHTGQIVQARRLLGNWTRR